MSEDSEEKPVVARAAPMINLDLQFELDEPLELMIELRRLADTRPHNSDWVVVASYASMAVDELKAKNEPR